MQSARYRLSSVVGVGAVATLVVIGVSAAISSCSPGALDCSGKDNGGFDCVMQGQGGDGGAGGMGGGGPPPRPAACTTLTINNIDEAEAKLVVPRCGTGPAGATCHTGTFPPRMDMIGTVRGEILKLPPRTRISCQSDPYINKANPAKSYMLAKITAPGEKMNCPTPVPNMPEIGGEKMPPMSLRATPLSNDERDCLVWYLGELARL